MSDKKITSFKQIKEIIEPIPANKFQTTFYGKPVFAGKERESWNGTYCVLGHIHKHLNPNETESALGDEDGYGARQLSRRMLGEVHDLGFTDIAEVNNTTKVNGYTEPEIKDRLMHFIEDGIKWEEGTLSSSAQ